METPEIEIFEILPSKSKKGPREKTKKVALKDPAELDAVILSLKAKKKKFKIVENAVEKLYEFNGNNYIVSYIKV
jgi:hypothetical protein